MSRKFSATFTDIDYLNPQSSKNATNTLSYSGLNVEHPPETKSETFTPLHCLTLADAPESNAIHQRSISDFLPPSFQPLPAG